MGDERSADDDVVVMVGRASDKELHSFTFPAEDFEDVARVELTAMSRALDLMKEDAAKEDQAARG